MDQNFYIYYLIIPITTGILSTIFYVIFVDKLFFQFFVPWYFSKKYKSTIIEGKWEGKSKFFKLNMNIIQYGDRVTGDIFVESFHLSEDKKEEHVLGSNSYDFHGEIRDGFVVINSKEKDRKRFGMGVYIFQIAGAGNNLNGRGTFINEDTEMHVIDETDELKLKRVH